MALMNGNDLKFCVKAYRKIVEENFNVIKDGEYSFYKKLDDKSFVFLFRGKYVVSFNEEILDVFIESKKYIT